jgi:hypothetical protein
MLYRCPVALFALLVFSPAADAQPPAPPSTPPNSPYLNLLRRGASPAVNYYGLVRPEQNLRQSLQGLQAATASNEQSIADLNTGGPAPTGANAQFFNHGRYFLTQRSGSGGGWTSSVSPTAGSVGGPTRPAGLSGVPIPRR